MTFSEIEKVHVLPRKHTLFTAIITLQNAYVFSIIHVNISLNHFKSSRSQEITEVKQLCWWLVESANRTTHVIDYFAVYSAS
jgi:hypothetical protein